MKTARLIFPHQLFKNTEHFDTDVPVYLIEEYLFFTQYNFHKQKLTFHRASMKYYAHYLTTKGLEVHYIDAQHPEHDVRVLLPQLILQGLECIIFTDPTDYYLSKRLHAYSETLQVKVEESPLFFNTVEENAVYFKDKKRLLHHDFYVYQRKKLGVLVDTQLNPEGGQWSFDADNRKKYPAKQAVPVCAIPLENEYHKEAQAYVEAHYAHNLGALTGPITYPVSHAEAEIWLADFLQRRFHEFGLYEDAMLDDQHILNHSLLSPLLNVGLLDIRQTVAQILTFAAQNQVPLNSTEGLIRQLIGWREYIRAIYERNGREERTRNFWNFTKPMPATIYEASTGLAPLDITLRKTYATAYAHHIERLMVLGNYMVLAEIHPNAVYKWFMESYIDAYDWVMVPNVYGMSQYADGGLMSTKPYISGSNYILKMSNFKKGDWADTWDTLFWAFLVKHRDFFKKNMRMAMLLSTFDKWSEDKKEPILSHIERNN